MVEREYGRCDVLVNSAGFTRMIPHADLEALTDELIDAIFVANVRGPFATIRAFAPLMKRSDAAVIINISSAAAFSGGGSNIAYGAIEGGDRYDDEVAGARAGTEYPRAVRCRQVRWIPGSCRVAPRRWWSGRRSARR